MNFARWVICSTLILILALAHRTVWADDSHDKQKDIVAARLRSPFFHNLYSKTYESLLNRVEPDGFLRESMTGAYVGMFPRTVGAIVSLFLETNELDRSERLIDCVLRATADNDMERIPHIIDKKLDPNAGDGGKGKTIYVIVSNKDEIDGQAHVLLAWARLAIRRGQATEFEDRTYPLVARLMDRSTDWPYVNDVVCLVHNPCFEHSREGRYWDTYDLLTQCFVGAALDQMQKIAVRRHDDAHAARWSARLTALREAIRKNMTRVVGGKTVYLEMRIPNSAAGVPFEGMGWVNLSPIAAQWDPLEDPLDHQVLRDTVDALRQRDLFDFNGTKWLATDWNADGTHAAQVIGKGIGWEIDYCRSEGEYDRITQWLDFLEKVNTTPVYMEAAGLSADGKSWNESDPGNGEQCAWWCWAMARLRKDVGLAAAP